MKATLIKRIVLWVFVGIVIVAFLVSAIFLLGGQIQEVRRSIEMQELSLEGSLREAVYEAALEDQLVSNEAEIKRIEEIMPAQDKVGLIIGVIESVAKKYGVTVLVPIVNEEIVTDKSGNRGEQTGLVRSVIMEIQVQGKPVSLIEFMHTVEHLPYLLGTVSFVFDSDADAVSGGSVFLVPGSKPVGAEITKIEERRASLKMEIRLTTRVGVVN